MRLFSSLTSLPVLSFELLTEMGLLIFSLTYVIRAQRKAGLLLALGATIAILSQIGSAAFDVAVMGALISKGGSSQQDWMSWMFLAVFFVSWTPYIGRALQLIAIGASIYSLISAIPPSARADGQ